MKKCVRGFCAALTASALLVSATPSVEAGFDWGKVLGSVIGTAINNSSDSNNGGNNGGNNGDLLGGLSNQSHAHKNPTNNEKLFILAVKNNDYGTIESMLDAGVDINGVYYDTSTNEAANGITAFLCALEANDRDMMQFLLTHGADVTGFYKFNNQHVSYLTYVANRFDVGLLEYLHNWGAGVNDVNQYYSHKYNPVTAITGAMWDRTRGSGHFPDNTAYDALSYVLNNGSNPDFNDHTYFDMPALLHVVTTAHYYQGAYKFIDLLADNGANLNIKDEKGRTAQDIALEYKDIELYKYIQNVWARGQQPSKYQEAKAASDAAAVKNKEVVSYSKHITKAMIAGNEAQDLLNNAGVPVQQIPLQDRVKIAKKMLGKLNESIKIIDENKLQLTKCTPEEKEKMTSWENGVKSLSMKQREYVMILAENRELTHEDYEQVISYMEEANNIANSNYDLLVAAQNYFHVKF